MNTVDDWLECLGLSQFVETFAENQIEFGDLSELTVEDLRELGIPMGPRKRLLKGIAALIEVTPAAGENHL